MILNDKIALVTGGSRGIGRAIALKLAEEGASIIINFLRHQEAAEKTAEEVRAKGVNCRIIRANVGDEQKVSDMFDTIASEFGHLDILINNAASGVARSILEIDNRAWDWTMDINAKALLFCARRAAGLMEGREGKIIAISSLGSRFVLPNYSIVGISKAALECLARYLAIELAPKGISVNIVAAGPVETEALKVYARESLSTTPAGRSIMPEDIANVVAFLCSKEAEMIRGQTIIVDGGLSIMGFRGSNE